MTSYERSEIQRLPEKYRPLTAWGYFFYSLLFSIPVVGLIALIICASSNSNINRRSYARSYFCALLISLIVIVVAVVAVVVLTVTGVIPKFDLSTVVEMLKSTK